MDTITIDQHTFCPSLLQGGWAIDAGARGFAFTNYCLDRGKVFALDIEDLGKDPSVSIVGSYFSKFIFRQAALTNYNGVVEGYFYGNGTGNFIEGINGKPGSTEDRPVKYTTVPTITLTDIYKEIGTEIDILKLDIEGAEYMVLDRSFEPIPKQITVECHEHCHPHLHSEHWEEIFERLCKDYHASLYISEWPRYKYMDCLFVRKDLL